MASDANPGGVEFRVIRDSPAMAAEDILRHAIELRAEQRAEAYYREQWELEQWQADEDADRRRNIRREFREDD